MQLATLPHSFVPQPLLHDIRVKCKDLVVTASAREGLALRRYTRATAAETAALRMAKSEPLPVKAEQD